MTREPRSREARDLAEAALVRLVHPYGSVPEFVLLGGLVPDLLCADAALAHVGTTDTDVQVDLEINGGSGNATRIEKALRTAGFNPDSNKLWTWRDVQGSIVKVEFLADLDDAPTEQTVTFKDCEQLGALNLRGTGYAAQSWEMRDLAAEIDGTRHVVSLRVATVAGYLLAKIHAAYGRNLPKDWYDNTYVLLHNDAGGPQAASALVFETFPDSLSGQTATAIGELAANFVDASAQGCRAYSSIMRALHPDGDLDTLANDAVAAVGIFVEAVRVKR